MSRPSPPPRQPAAFAAWLADGVRIPGWVAGPARFERDGALTLPLRSTDGAGDGAVRWVVSQPLPEGALVVDGIGGGFEADGLGAPQAEAVALAVRSAVRCFDPEILRTGAAFDELVSFTLEHLGMYLERQLEPGETRWGAHRLVAFEQPEPSRLLLRWESDDEADRQRVVVALAPSAWSVSPDDPKHKARFRRAAVEVEVVEDGRPEARSGAAGAAIEDLVGFSLARALAADPELWFPEPGGAAGSGDGDGSEGADGSDGSDGGGECGDCSCEVKYLQRHKERVRHEAFSRCWNADYRWHRFLYPPSRCIVNLFRLGADEAFVVHESLECILNEPPWSPPDSTIFANRRNVRVGEFWQRCRMVITDLDDRDVVAGKSLERLDDALEAAAAASPNRSVVVKSGCLPNVIGDNPLPSMTRIGKKTGVRFYWIASSNDYWSYTASLVRDRLGAVAPPEAERDPLGVAIVGGATRRENAELLGLLERVGLHPLGIILPSIDYRNFEDVARASVFAWANQTSLRNIGEMMFDGLPVSLIRPRAPAGLAGTMGWLGRVVEQVDPASPVAATYAALAEAPPWAERLDTLKRRTAQFELAFVADPEELEVVCDTTELYGYSLLELVLEMGFSVRLVVKGQGERPGYERVARAMRERGLGERVRFVSFETPAELAARLSEPRIGAVLSDYTADPRAVAAGRNTFSEVDVELGVEGFFRTAEHLMRLCALRPLAGYEAYLAPGAPS